ncbi:MAG: sugar transferase [Oscillochloridaceae bacterium umkhey_bin13]
MQVIMLATGEQQRLAPVTDTIPPAMVPIMNRPVMATSIEVVARAGYKQVLVSLYQQGGQIAAYFGAGRRWGLELKYLTQRQALGSAGSLRWAGGLLDQTFLVLPGDGIFDFDLDQLLAAHRAHGGMVTMVLHELRAGSQAPYVQCDAAGRVLGLGSSEVATLQATGVFIFEPAVLRYIPNQGPSDLLGDLLPALLNAGEPIHSHVAVGYWNSLDSLAAYHEAQQVYLYSAYAQAAPEQVPVALIDQVRFPSLDSRQIAPGIWVGRDHSIHPSVKLAAPVYLGDNCWIGREVELDAGTVVGSDVVIDDEATVSTSTILSNTYVGRLVRIEERIVTPDTISEPATGATTRIVDPFLIGRVGAADLGRNPFQQLMSRLVAVGLLVILSPLLLVVALVAALGSGGRILVRLPRIGQRRDGPEGGLQTFQLYRFCTRKAQGHPTWTGRLLERLEFDRLPELLNVLNGELALVGVKPLRPEEAESLTEEWHQRRHEVPPGLTGLWYIQTETEHDLDTVIVADVYYTATRNWRSDLLILARTPGTWLWHLRRGPSPTATQTYPVPDDKIRTL